MLLCRGKGCIWRRVCARFVIGIGAEKYAGVAERWIDRCLHASKFLRTSGSRPEERPTGNE